MERTPIKFWEWAKYKEKLGAQCNIENRPCSPVLHECCCMCFEADMSTRRLDCKEV